MGSFFSVSTIDDEEELDRRRNFKFIIPSDRLLCAAQLDLLRAEGVFQGVPFVIAGDHAERSVLSRKLIRNTIIPVTVTPSTVQLVPSPDSTNTYHISFCYDSVSPCVCSIYVGGKDISSGSSIKIADERAYLGPFRLDEGRNVVWSTSQVPGVYIKKQSLQYIGKLTSNSYDLTIVIMPLFSTPTNKKQPAQVKHTTKTVIPQGFLGTLHSDGGGAAGSSLVDALFFNFKKSSKAKPTSSSYINGMKFVNRKLEVNGIVYYIFNIFSSSSNNTDTPARTPDVRDSEKISIEIAGASSEQLCVICLSAPSTVTVLPCRHCCLCTECVQAIPTGSGKCPICRSFAALFLK